LKTKSRAAAGVRASKPGLKHHEVFYRFPPVRRQAPAGFRVNFLGVRTREAFFTQWGDRRRSTTDYPDFDEEYFEWIDLLEAVAHAEGQFTMLELGAGFGYWLANAAAALKQSTNLPYALVGVEAEPTHFRWMKENLIENQVDLSQCRLIEAAVADRDGTIGFHVGETPHGGPADWYGQKIGGPTDVRAVSLNTLLCSLDNVDLIDLDVEGAEQRILEAAGTEINAKVKRIHIETHSHEVEAGLRSLFTELGWVNLRDYPCQSETETEWGRVAFQGGVQSWVNPRFFSSAILREMRAERLSTAPGFDLLLNSEDFLTSLLHRDGVFEPAETDLLTTLLRPGDTCLDAGCHVGYYTCLMAQLVAPGGRVYAFDANPWCCQRTLRNVAVNNFTGVEVVQAALGNQQATFHVSTVDQTGLSSLGPIEHQSEIIWVPWLRLEDFLRQRRIRHVRLLKVDVEGAEELVLEGLGRFLSDQAIDFILMECYDERLQLLRTSAERVTRLVESAGYVGWEFGIRYPSGWSSTAHAVSRGDCNYLFASPKVKQRLPAMSLAGSVIRLRTRVDQLQVEGSTLRNQRAQWESQARGLQAEKERLLQEKGALEEEWAKGQQKIQWLLSSLAALEQEATRLRQTWHMVENSASWRALSAWREMRNRLAPEGSRRRRLYDRLLARFRGAG